MNDYDATIRDLARRGLDKIDNADMATIIEEHPDVVAEAMDPQLVAETLRLFTTSTAIAAAFLSMLRVRCGTYVCREVGHAKQDIEQEERVEREFNREAV